MTKKQQFSKQIGSLQGNKPDYPAPTKRSQGRNVVQTEQDIQISFDLLNEQFKAAGYELIIRRPVLKELVSFDYGLMFTRGTSEVNIYVDDDVRKVIDHLLETNEKVVIKCNWFSPDTVCVTVPKMPQDSAGDVLGHDTSEVIPE